MRKHPNDDRKGSRRRQARVDEQRHHWVYGAGKWRCGKCTRMTRAADLTTEHRNQKCEGPKRSLNVRDMVARGHQIMAADTTPPIAYCIRCGAFSVRRARLLMKDSAGAPTPHGRVALERIARGLHPWDHGVSKRSRGESNNFCAWNAVRDKWTPSGGAGESGGAVDETQNGAAASQEQGDAVTCTHDSMGILACSAAADVDCAGEEYQMDRAVGERGLDNASSGSRHGKRKADSLFAAVDHALPQAARRRVAGRDFDADDDVMHDKPCLPSGTQLQSRLPTASAQRDGEGEEAFISVNSRDDLLRHLRAVPGHSGGAAAANRGEAGAPGGGASPIDASRHGDFPTSSGRLHVSNAGASPRVVADAPRLPAPATRAELLRRLAGT